MNLVENIPVAADETGMRLDRWFKVHFPGPRLRPIAEAAALGANPRGWWPRQKRHPPFARTKRAHSALRYGVEKRDRRHCRQAGDRRHHEGAGRRRSAARHAAARGQEGLRFQQAGRACRAGRFGPRAPCRFDAGSAAQRKGREASPRPPARPRHLRRAGRGAHARRRRGAGQILPHARHGEDLLGHLPRAFRASSRAVSRPGWSRKRPTTATRCASPSMASRMPIIPRPTTASSILPHRT